MPEPKLADTEVITPSWVDMAIKASLKDYVTREIHDRDFKELRDRDEAIKESVTDLDKEVTGKISVLNTEISGKLEKPSFWLIVFPFICGLIGWIVAHIWD